MARRGWVPLPRVSSRTGGQHFAGEPAGSPGGRGAPVRRRDSMSAEEGYLAASDELVRRSPNPNLKSRISNLEYRIRII